MMHDLKKQCFENADQAYQAGDLKACAQWGRMWLVFLAFIAHETDESDKGLATELDRILSLDDSDIPVEMYG